jgi:transmembrane sensor
LTHQPSSPTRPDRRIREEAARWVAQEDIGPLTDQDEAQLSCWLAADPEHQQAYDRARLLWAALDGVEETPQMRPARTGAAIPHRARRWPMARPSGKGIAASLAACAAVLAITVATDLPTRLQADAMTSVGEQKLVSLPDGSTALLDTHSAIAIDYAPGARRVRLLMGEAFFTVKADPARAFTVAAKGGSARALGTQFIAQDQADGAVITVTQHRVRVSFKGDHGDIAEGQRLSYDARHGLSAPESIDVADADAWTRGRLVAVNRPLGDIVAEISRYHSGYVHVAPEIAAMPVSGNFRTSDPVAALDQICKALGLSSRRMTNRLIYIYK